MDTILTIALVLVIVYFAIIFGGAFTVFQKNLCRRKKKKNDEDTMSKDWKKQMEESRRCQELISQSNPREVVIGSVDGLKLYGTLVYAKEPTDRIVLCVHGYGGNGLDDMSIFAPFYQKQNCHMLFIDQRCSGKSEGKIFGFGFWERRDIKCWCDFLVKEFGEKSKILLHGWSMGAASSMMAVEIGLPEQVKGLVFDCGYTSAIEEFRHVAKQSMHLPKFLSEPIISVASSFCKIQAGYPFREAEVLSAIDRVKLPILCIHGTKDNFVPTWMGEQIYEACMSTQKEQLLVEGAFHCLSYQKAKKEYEEAVLRLMERAGM